MRGSLSYTSSIHLYRSFLIFAGTLIILHNFIPALKPVDIPVFQAINWALGTVCISLSIISTFASVLSRNLRIIGYVAYSSLFVWLLLSAHVNPNTIEIPIIIWVMLAFSGNIFQSFKSFSIFATIALIALVLWIFRDGVNIITGYHFWFTGGLIFINGLLMYMRNARAESSEYGQIIEKINPIPTIEITIFGEIINYNQAAFSVFPDLAYQGELAPIILGFKERIHSVGSSFMKEPFFFEWTQYDNSYRITCQYIPARDSFVLHCQDITRMEELKGREHERKEMFQIILQGTNEGLIMVDTTGKISFVNQQFCKLFGFKEKELLGRDAAGLLVDDSDPEMIRQRLEDRMNGKSQVYQATQTTKNGNKLWTLISASPYRDRNGNVKGTIAAITDLSPLKKAQEELEERNEQMDMFLYKASHDLKGPLASVKGILNLALQYCKEEEVRNYIEMAITSSDRLDNAVVDLLRVTRINNLQLQLEAVDVPSLVYEVIRSIDHMDERQDVQIIPRIDIDREFYTDRGSFHSILQNLVINAVKYKNPYESQPKVEIDISSYQDGIKISVADNGEGIRQDVQEKVFKMFYRGNKKSKGTGLGLYIVKQSVEKMKGNIQFESEPGKGTTFKVDLPHLHPHLHENREVTIEKVSV